MRAGDFDKKSKPIIDARKIILDKRVEQFLQAEVLKLAAQSDALKRFIKEEKSRLKDEKKAKKALLKRVKKAAKKAFWKRRWQKFLSNPSS